MKKIINLHPLRTLFISIMMFMLIGCTATTPTVTPPALATSLIATPSYIHYLPSEASNTGLEFDYPSYLVFNDDKPQYRDGLVIFLGDPRLLTVPTRVPGQSHGTPSDFGSVHIYIEPAKPDQTLDSLVKAQKQIDIDANPITFLCDYQIEIDNQKAHVIETLNDYPEVYTSVMFNRKIFFIVNDRVYMIDFFVSEKERGGEFEKGYEHFFNSLKIVRQ
jgi:hypothetical protein